MTRPLLGPLKILGGQARRNIHRCAVLRQQQELDLPSRRVTDGDIARLASQPLHPLTLRDLVRYGRPPLSTEQLLESANFTLTILPSRLAHRIQSLRSLPYIVVANPHVARIHNNYVRSLSTLLPFAEKKIESLQEEIRLTEAMADLVHTHANTISILARGFLEARKYITPEEVTAFLDEHLRARIGTRLIAEQHIALHLSSKPHADVVDGEQVFPEEHRSSSHIGVIDTALRPAHVIRHCEATVGEMCELKYGVRPSIIIDGEPDTTAIAHSPMHLEYILTELLKNSFRATIESGTERDPIQVTVAPASEGDEEEAAEEEEEEEDDKSEGLNRTGQGAADEASSASPRTGPERDAVKRPDAHGIPLGRGTQGVTIRIRDRGGGISPENMTKLWDYGFTTFDEETIMDTIRGGGGGGGGGGAGGGAGIVNTNTDGSGGLDAISGVGGGAGGAASSLAGLGYGLPLGRAYAEYFGGGIAVQSLYGWGTDVYLTL